MRLRVRDKWHPHINGDESPWVYSDHPNFEGSLEAFLLWVSVHNGSKLDGVEVVHLLEED